jgi:hypothetical protein
MSQLNKLLSLKRGISFLAMVTLIVIAAGLLYLVYRQIGAPLQLMPSAVVVDGNIMEKLVQTRRLSPLPVEVPAYVVRYAYPNPQGQMRTGEQVVTKAFFNRLDEQGAAVEVYLNEADPTVNAVDPRITFPSVSGVRAWAAAACLLAAYLILLFGVMSKSETV